jgi:hypothetical protein
VVKEAAHTGKHSQNELMNFIHSLFAHFKKAIQPRAPVAFEEFTAFEHDHVTMAAQYADHVATKTLDN